LCRTRFCSLICSLGNRAVQRVVMPVTEVVHLPQRWRWAQAFDALLANLGAVALGGRQWVSELVNGRTPVNLTDDGLQCCGPTLLE
jgi:hypothetical protein